MQTGSWRNELLFKARTQFLEVNGRIHRWSAEGCRVCKVCASREIESVAHMILECDKYEEEKQIFMDLVNSETDERLFETWSDNEREAMCFILGLTEVTNVYIIEAMKIFLINIWKKRKCSLRAGEDRVTNDH